MSGSVPEIDVNVVGVPDRLFPTVANRFENLIFELRREYMPDVLVLIVGLTLLGLVVYAISTCLQITSLALWVDPLTRKEAEHIKRDEESRVKNDETREGRPRRRRARESTRDGGEIFIDGEPVQDIGYDLRYKSQRAQGRRKNHIRFAVGVVCIFVTVVGFFIVGFLANVYFNQWGFATGAYSLTFGLAMRPLLTNVIAALTLYYCCYYVPGDDIQVLHMGHVITGRLMHIGWLNTELRCTDAATGVSVIRVLPNSTITESPITIADTFDAFAEYIPPGQMPYFRRDYELGRTAHYVEPTTGEPTTTPPTAVATALVTEAKMRRRHAWLHGGA